MLCWRCTRNHTPKGDSYPTLPYLSGYMTYVTNAAPQKLEGRHCDECGVLIDENC